MQDFWLPRSWQLLGKLKAYSTKLKEQVEAKDAKLQEIGYKAYLEGMKK